ncbi:MAG: hypothetical protein RL139_375 [Gemmatimonadota bacterium]
MSADRGLGGWFVPGPVAVRPAVLDAMTRPMIAHRSAEYEALHARIATGLQGAFGTERPVWLLTASATGAMELALRGLPPGKVLALVNGEFADRFAQIAESCGHTVQRLFAPFGGVVPLAEVEAALVTGDVRAVTMVHVETSTGAQADVAAVAALARHYGALSLVDSVTGVGGIPVATDAWGLDFVCTGSQKALAMPPGLAFAVASPAYLAAARRARHRGFYLDPLRVQRFAERSQSPTTPALSLLYAADAQLEAIAAEGFPARWARHAAMGALTAEWMVALQAEGIDLRWIAAEGARAATVSGFIVPDGVDAEALVARVAGLGFTIGSGYGPLRSASVRIGHMGEHGTETLAPCLEAVRTALRVMVG